MVQVKHLKICILAVLVLCLSLNACSDAQNRTKTTVPKDNSVEVSVASKSTTDGASTTETLDKDIEETAIRTLKVLFGGDAKENNFESKDAYGVAKTIFTKNPNANITANIHYLKSDESNSLITATAKSKGSQYQIYMNNEGKIIGFEKVVG
mgnify:CR=1 FL=1